MKGLVSLLVVCLLASTATAAKLNMLINQSPWFDGFRKTLVMYEEETGETIELDVTPYPGMSEKIRNTKASKHQTSCMSCLLSLLVLDQLSLAAYYDISRTPKIRTLTSRPISDNECQRTTKYSALSRLSCDTALLLPSSLFCSFEPAIAKAAAKEPSGENDWDFDR